MHVILNWLKQRQSCSVQNSLSMLFVHSTDVHSQKTSLYINKRAVLCVLQSQRDSYFIWALRKMSFFIRDKMFSSVHSTCLLSFRLAADSFTILVVNILVTCLGTDCGVPWAYELKDEKQSFFYVHTFVGFVIITFLR